MSSWDVSVFTCRVGYHAAFSEGHTYLTYPIPRIIDYPRLLSPPLFCTLSIIPRLPHSLAHPALLGLFTIYSMLLHHLSLLSPDHLSLPPSHLTCSYTEVIVSRKITADKSIPSFFIFSLLYCFPLPHNSCSHTSLLILKPSTGQWSPIKCHNHLFSPLSC